MKADVEQQGASLYDFFFFFITTLSNDRLIEVDSGITALTGLVEGSGSVCGFVEQDGLSDAAVR